MNTEAIIPEVVEQIPDKLPKMTPQMHGYAILREQGLSVGQAAQASGYTRQNGYLLEKKFDKYKLTNNTKLLKLAHTAVKNTLQGKSTGDAQAPKTSDILNASQMIYDRSDPKVHQQVNLSLSMELSPVDLSLFKER